MNELADETSPYLRQHATNPVDWLPWGEEALARARRDDKPILLSIGYSACHWCHVMAHESFEDAETAALMNALFVNVKVDREERPDLDQIYQSAHHLLTRRNGGWPLTMFLCPDQTPFFGGTYFPPQARYQLPGFKDLLRQVARAYRERRVEIERQNASLIDALVPVAAPASHAGLDAAVLSRAVDELAETFDDVYGGFGQAPKFPHPSELDLCLRLAVEGGHGRAREMALTTLRRMAAGGIYDQIGGGFCRYSVDRFWAIPHFEKMLYDNGPLLALYSDAWRLTRDPAFARVVAETIDWLQGEMHAPGGAFCSSLDADSEGVEGKFYVWSRDALREALGADDFALAEAAWGLDAPANVEDHAWHLQRRPDAEACARLGLDLAEYTRRLAAVRGKAAALRAGRVRPARDDKVLTSWNALAIRGLARAGSAFRRADWIRAAQRAVDFLRNELWQDGRLLATWQGGRARLNAYLDDYAFLIDALVESIQAGYRASDVTFACALADTLLERFEDRERGGFWFTSHDHEALIARPKSAADNATPSGNGVAARALIRLGHLTGCARYIEAGERVLECFAGQVERRPSAFASLLTALQDALEPPTLVVVRGEPAATAVWLDALQPLYAPGTVLVAPVSGHEGLPLALAKPELPGVNAWVCRGVNCLPSISDLHELRAVCQFGEVVT